MKIVFLNASPKLRNSASGVLLTDLKECVLKEIKDAEVTDINLHKPEVSEETIELIKNMDILVFSFPLYVDGLPSHFLSCLCQLQRLDFGQKSIGVYGIANCGFYEGKQNECALHILENWCSRMQFQWKMGLGVGGGGSLSMMGSVPFGHGPKKPIDVKLEQMVQSIKNGFTEENQYVSVGMPRFAYKLAAELGWKQTIRANGGKIRDLGRRL